MTRSALLLHGGVALLVAALAAASGEAMEPTGGLAALVEIAPPADAISPRQRAAIRAAIAAYEKRKGAGTAQRAQRDAAEEPFLYPFFPHAGVLGRDLLIVNFTDQDPSTGLIRDWDCSDYTYDGHHGHDSLIRSFREQAIGVPVFAVRDGVVVDAHDGEPDTQHRVGRGDRGQLRGHGSRGRPLRVLLSFSAGQRGGVAGPVGDRRDSSSA